MGDMTLTWQARSGKEPGPLLESAVDREPGDPDGTLKNPDVSKGKQGLLDYILPPYDWGIRYGWFLGYDCTHYLGLQLVISYTNNHANIRL